MKDTIPFEEAVAMLDPDAAYIHTFVCAPPGLLLGADMSRSRMLALLRNAAEIGLAGEIAQSMRHGLVVKYGGQELFIATIINK